MRNLSSTHIMSPSVMIQVCVLSVLLLLPAIFAASDLELAERHIPIFHFDKHAQEDCYPDEARDGNDEICQPFNSSAPVYYSVQRCQGYIKVAFWLWYGWQGKCSVVFGSHGNDWEHIVINLLPDESMHSVTYYQHNGWFTDCTQPQNPVVYVGQVSHGSYSHSCSILNVVNPRNLFILGREFCTNSCLYWDDHREIGGVEWRPTAVQLLPIPTEGNVAGRHDNEDYFSPSTKNKCFNPLVVLRLGAMQNGCWWQVQDNQCEFPAPNSCQGI